MRERLLELAERQGPLVYLVLFALFLFQTGFLVGPVIPGNPLVFAAGALAAPGVAALNPLAVWIALGAGAFLGNLLNHRQGRAAGPRLERSAKWGERLARARTFFEARGRAAVTVAAFVPFYRAWVPFVAGAAGMPFPRFALASAAGAFGWIGVWTLLGYSLGTVPVVRDNVDKIVIGIVLVVTVVAVAKTLAARRQS